VGSVLPGPAVPGWPAHLVELAALLAIPAASRRVRLRLRKVHLLLWLLVMFAGTFVLNGCGGGNNNANPPRESLQKTAPGTYAITVVGTSGTVSHSVSVTLVVQ
jgi:hypothetical protein